MKDGGPAFPTPIALSPQGDVYYADMATAGGMTKLQWMAGTIAAGIAAKFSNFGGSYNKEIANHAVHIAEHVLRLTTK